MKWYESSPVLFLGCTLFALLVYFICLLDIPSGVTHGMILTVPAAVAVHSTTDFKRRFPDLNSKTGYAILFLLFALAYAIAQTTL